MKLKTFAILVVVAALLGGWAWWISRRPFAAAPAAVGARVLPPFPINEVAKITVLAPGTNIVLAKRDGVWTVASRFNYPAKFGKVVEALRELDGLKVGQALAVAPDRLDTFKLLSPPTNGAPDPAGSAGARVELFNEHNQPLASLVIGKPFMSRSAGGPPGMDGYPNGQYVRAGGDRVFLVAQNLGRLTENVKYWLDEEFISLPAQDILELSVTGPERAPIVLRRGGDENAALALDGLGPEEGVADSARIDSLAGALNYFGFDDVAAPALTAKDAGLDRPVVVTARTKQGQVYTLRLGNALTNDTFDRYAQVGVVLEAPPAPAKADAQTNAAAAAVGETPPKDPAAETAALAEKTRTLDAKLSPWIYVVKSYRVEPLLVKREELIKKPEPPAPKPEAPDGGQPAAAENAPRGE